MEAIGVGEMVMADRSLVVIAFVILFRGHAVGVIGARRTRLHIEAFLPTFYAACPRGRDNLITRNRLVNLPQKRQ